jgi:hypothetical protein
MPRVSNVGEMAQQNIRLPMELVTYAKEEAKKSCGGSISEYLRQLLNDVRTCYGVPHHQLERLEADRERLDISETRQYIRHVISVWAERVVVATAPKRARPSAKADTSSVGEVQHTVRLPLAVWSYAKEQAQKEFNGSLSQYIRQVVYDAKTYYGVPHHQLERLEADRKRLNITEPRRYVQDIMSLWSEQLASTPPGKAGSRKQ